jgi:endonuclease/exonuclease/phosphatase family metal-dependent hydrolase
LWGVLRRRSVGACATQAKERPMAKLFSVASWNVEHFKDEPERVARVIEFLKKQNPDVFGLYEVEGAQVFSQLVAKMPNYTFQITEGVQTQEILIGVKKTITAFITQKTEFKSGTTHMRPGQLVAVRKNDKNYGLLFLHVASGSDPRGMGLRDDMIDRAFEFRRVLDKSAGGEGQARYIFMGDLNTMGLTYPFKHSIAADLEIKKAEQYAARKKIAMRHLAKTHDVTWSNGSQSSIPASNLDHVFASTNLSFKTFKRPDGATAEVDVRGWVTEPTTAKQDKFIEELSDHSLLYFEIHG